MGNKIFFRFVALGAFFLGFSQPSFALESSDRLAIEALEGRYVTAWNQHDVNAISTVFTLDADIVNRLGEKFTGISEIEEQHRKTHATFLKNAKMKITRLELRELSPTVVLGHLSLEMSQLAELGNSTNGAAVFTQVFVKKEGEWFITASSAHKKL